MAVDPQETRTGQNIPTKSQSTEQGSVKENITTRYKLARKWLGIAFIGVGILSALNAYLHTVLNTDSITFLYNMTAILWLCLVWTGIITAHILGLCKGVMLIGISICILPLATLLRNWLGFELSFGTITALQVSVAIAIILLVIGIVLKIAKNENKG